MSAQKKQYYEQFKDHILKSPAGQDQFVKEIIEEVLSAVEDVNLLNEVEPGVAIIESLEGEIQGIIAKACEKKRDLGAVAHALVIGAFKTSQVVEDEAHATIALLARYILQSTAQACGDIGGVTRGLIAGVIDQAGEGKLNTDAAASEAATSAYYEAKELGPDAEKAVEEAVKEQIKGVTITIYKQHPKKKIDIKPAPPDEN